MKEKELQESFKRDLSEAKKYMEPIQQRMDRDYEVYRNYRENKDFEFKKSDLFEYVETVVPIVTNNRIRGSVRSDYPDYVTHAKALNDILDHTYDINNWDYLSQYVFKMSMIYRSALVYTGYDGKYRNGTGKLEIEQCNMRWAYVDPSALELEDSRFFFYVQPMRETQVLKLHPDKKEEIKKAKDKSNQSSFYGNMGQSEGWFRSWINNIRSASSLVFNHNASQARRVSENPFMPEMTEEDKYRNVMAYIHYWYRDEEDNWRKSCWANDVLLEDGENPYWHGCLPYDMLSPIRDTLSMLGVPISEQIESMSVNRNALMNYYIINARKQADPPLLWNTSFGNAKDPSKLREEAEGTGVIAVTNPDMVPLNAIADYMSVPQMNPQAASMYEQLGNVLDATTGVNDSFRGTQQATSGKEVQLQQEAAYNRIKTMIDQFELFNKKIAEKIIVNAMQYYTQTRGFRIKGDPTKYQADQASGQPMPFEIENVNKGVDPNSGEPIIDKTEYYLYANPSEWTQMKPDVDVEEEGDEEKKEVKKAFKVLQMTVEIEAGSSLPQSRLARREEANELFGAGVIDQTAILDAYDWPDREEVIKRMQEAAQAAQQAQAEAAQAEAQSKMQLEQQKMEQQMQLETMKLQSEMQKSEMNNNAKLEQQQLSNRGEIAEQGLDNTNDLASTLDMIRQQFPELAQMPDDQLISLLMGQPA